MSTRIAVLSEGRIEQIGTPSEIYYRPNSRFVADFIGESNFLHVDTSRSSNGVVHLADGRPVPCSRRDWSGEASATLMVRPESIHVAVAGDGPAASLKGRIVHTSFLGSQTRIAVRCDAVPAPVTVSQFGRERLAAGDLAPDKEVSLWWDPEDAVLLAQETTEEEGD